MSAPIRLTGDELDRFAERVALAEPLLATAIAEGPVDAASVPVPAVLGDLVVYRVTVAARRRPIELLVADVGDELVPLGDVSSVDLLASRLGLRLETQADVTEFLRFWCRATGRPGDHLVESAADFRWIPGVTTDPELRTHADRAAHLARRITVGHAAGGAFPAEITMLHQRTLVLRQLRVAHDGHVDEFSRVVLIDDVPVPYTML